MRVTFNTFPDTLLGRLQSLGGEQNKALTQLSSGQRLAAPSDDAPAMQRILNLRTEKKQNQQFYRNAADGLEKSKVTFASLEQIKDLVVRASELSANISGASSDQEFKAKASEINQLIEQGLNVANTKLRGNYLFSGDSNFKIPFVENRATDGKISSVSYTGSAAESQIHIGEGESASIIVGSAAQENGDIAGALNELIRLRDAMEAKGTPQDKADAVINLRTGKSDAVAPNSIISTTSPTALLNFSSGHGLVAGDRITLNLVAGQGTGLNNTTNYYVKFVDGNKVELSTTSDGSAVQITSAITAASTFIKVNSLSSTTSPTTLLNFPSGHGLVAGDRITLNLFTGQGTGLNNTTNYYVKSVDGNKVELSTTSGGSAVQITSGITAASTFKKADTITLPAPVSFKPGDKIVFNFSGDATSANQDLANEETYYVKSINGTSMQISAIPGGDPIIFTQNISGSFSRVDGLGEMEDKILSALSRAGTIQYRLEVASKDLETRYEATENLISKDADIDFAEATVRLNRAQMAYQAAIQSGARIQSNSLLDYIR